MQIMYTILLISVLYRNINMSQIIFKLFVGLANLTSNIRIISTTSYWFVVK